MDGGAPPPTCGVLCTEAPGDCVNSGGGNACTPPKSPLVLLTSPVAGAGARALSSSACGFGVPPFPAADGVELVVKAGIPVAAWGGVENFPAAFGVTFGLARGRYSGAVDRSRVLASSAAAAAAALLLLWWPLPAEAQDPPGLTVLFHGASVLFTRGG